MVMLTINIFHEEQGILIGADNHVMIARQITEFCANEVGANAPAQAGSRIRNCDRNGVTFHLGGQPEAV
jgi:hypothetical protein